MRWYGEVVKVMVSEQIEAVYQLSSTSSQSFELKFSCELSSCCCLSVTPWTGGMLVMLSSFFAELAAASLSMSECSSSLSRSRVSRSLIGWFMLWSKVLVLKDDLVHRNALPKDIVLALPIGKVLNGRLTLVGGS